MKKEILSKVYELLQNYGVKEGDFQEVIEEKRADVGVLPQIHSVIKDAFLHIYDETKEDKDNKISFRDFEESITKLFEVFIEDLKTKKASTQNLKIENAEMEVKLNDFLLSLKKPGDNTISNQLRLTQSGEAYANGKRLATEEYVKLQPVVEAWAHIVVTDNNNILFSDFQVMDVNQRCFLKFAKKNVPINITLAEGDITDLYAFVVSNDGINTQILYKLTGQYPAPSEWAYARRVASFVIRNKQIAVGEWFEDTFYSMCGYCDVMHGDKNNIHLGLNLTVTAIHPNSIIQKIPVPRVPSNFYISGSFFCSGSNAKWVMVNGMIGAEFPSNSNVIGFHNMHFATWGGNCRFKFSAPGRFYFDIPRYTDLLLKTFNTEWKI